MVKIFSSFRIRGKMCEDLTWFDFLNVHSSENVENCLMMGDSTLCTCKPGLFQLFLHRLLEISVGNRIVGYKYWSCKSPEFYTMTCAENIRYSSLRHVRSLGFSVAANAVLLPPPLAVLPSPPPDFPFVLTIRCACSRTQTWKNTSSTAQCNMQLT